MLTVSKASQRIWIKCTFFISYPSSNVPLLGHRPPMTICGKKWRPIFCSLEFELSTLKFVPKWSLLGFDGFIRCCFRVCFEFVQGSFRILLEAHLKHAWPKLVILNFCLFFLKLDCTIINCMIELQESLIRFCIDFWSFGHLPDYFQSCFYK